MKFLFLLIASVYLLQPSTAACPEERSVMLLAEILSAECMEGFSRVSNSSLQSSSDKYRAGIQQVCVEECINNITDHFRVTCNDTALAIGYDNGCLLSNNAGIGPTCRMQPEQRLSATATFEAAAGCYSFFFTGTCLETCRQGLMGISEQFDCCYQHYFNNTAFLTASFEDGQYTQQALDFLIVIGNASLWEECNVPLIGMCLERIQPTMATGGAVRAFGTLATSITAAFTAAASTFILSTL